MNNKKTHELVKEIFFVSLSVHAIGKTNTMKIECTFTNNDDKHDKDDKQFFGPSTIKEHMM